MLLSQRVFTMKGGYSFNEAQTFLLMRRMATLSPRGEAWISETGSHFAMYNDQQNYFRALLGFLKA
jgi:hypothetical protein